MMLSTALAARNASRLWKLLAFCAGILALALATLPKGEAAQVNYRSEVRSTSSERENLFKRDTRSTHRNSNMERHQFGQQMVGAGMVHGQLQQAHEHEVNFGPGHFVNVASVPTVESQSGIRRDDDRTLHPSQFEALSPFTCEGKMPGYYADLRASCQVYHVCKPDSAQESYHCPNGTIFGGSVLICNWWYKTACGFDGPLHPEDTVSTSQPNLVFADQDAARLPSSRLREFDSASMSFTGGAGVGNVHEVQYPEFIPIAPPFDLSPRPHPALTRGSENINNHPGAVDAIRHVHSSAPESANLMAPNLEQSLQHPQHSFMLQGNNHQGVSQHNHQNLHQQHFMHQASHQTEPLFAFHGQQPQAANQLRNAGAPQQQFVVNSAGSGFRSFTRREGGNEPTQQTSSQVAQQQNLPSAQDSNNDYQYISMDEMRQAQKQQPRKFKMAAGPSTIGPQVAAPQQGEPTAMVQPDNTMLAADGTSDRQFVLKLKRANDTHQQDGKKNLSFHWSGFEHPPPYDTAIKTNSTTPGPQKLTAASAGNSGSLPFTELEISGKIRIPVSPERLFRAVPLFREFHYKESEVGNAPKESVSKDSGSEPEAEANNEVNVVDKSGSLIRNNKFIHNGRFHLIGPVINTLAVDGQQGSASTLVQETVPSGQQQQQQQMQHQQQRQQLRKVSEPQALVDIPTSLQSSNSTTPSSTMVKTTIVTSVSTSQSSSQDISKPIEDGHPLISANTGQEKIVPVDKNVPFGRKVRIQGTSDGHHHHQGSQAITSSSTSQTDTDGGTS